MLGPSSQFRPSQVRSARTDASLSVLFDFCWFVCFVYLLLFFCFWYCCFMVIDVYSIINGAVGVIKISANNYKNVLHTMSGRTKTNV